MSGLEFIVLSALVVLSMVMALPGILIALGLMEYTNTSKIKSATALFFLLIISILSGTYIYRFM